MGGGGGWRRCLPCGVVAQDEALKQKSLLLFIGIFYECHITLSERQFSYYLLGDNKISIDTTTIIH